MVTREPLKVGSHCLADLLRLFDFQEVPNQARVVRGLSRQSMRWLPARSDLRVRQNLDFLFRFRYSVRLWWSWQDRSVYQR